MRASFENNAKKSRNIRMALSKTLKPVTFCVFFSHSIFIKNLVSKMRGGFGEAWKISRGASAPLSHPLAPPLRCTHFAFRRDILSQHVQSCQLSPVLEIQITCTRIWPLKQFFKDFQLYSIHHS